MLSPHHQKPSPARRSNGWNSANNARHFDQQLPLQPTQVSWPSSHLEANKNSVKPFASMEATPKQNAVESTMITSTTTVTAITSPTYKGRRSSSPRPASPKALVSVKTSAHALIQQRNRKDSLDDPSKEATPSKSIVRSLSPQAHADVAKTKKSNDENSVSLCRSDSDNPLSKESDELDTALPFSEAIGTMRMGLVRYSRSNDRRMMIQTISQCQPLTRCWPMTTGPFAVESKAHIAELESEVGSSPVVVNGMVLQSKRFSRNETLRVLQGVCTGICTAEFLRLHDSTKNQLDAGDEAALSAAADAVYQAILLRVSETSTVAAAQKELSTLMGSHELLVQPVQKKTPRPVPVPSLCIYGATGHVHCFIKTYHVFGLYRKMDVAIGRPWIEMQVQIQERTNITSKQSARWLILQIIGKTS